MENIHQYDEQGKKQGEWIDYYPDGNIYCERNYLDDKYHGLFVSYYKNGYIGHKNYFFNGEMVNLQESFHECGLLAIEIFFHRIF
jgi:antitoxin component YwqK of YwqJK toxin-antitoxin module